MTFDELKAKYTSGTWEQGVESGDHEDYNVVCDGEPIMCGYRSTDEVEEVIALHNVFPSLVERYEAMQEACGAMLDEYEAGRSIQPFEIREMCRKALALAAKPLTETGS